VSPGVGPDRQASLSQIKAAKATKGPSMLIQRFVLAAVMVVLGASGTAQAQFHFPKPSDIAAKAKEALNRSSPKELVDKVSPEAVLRVIEQAIQGPLKNLEAIHASAVYDSNTDVVDLAPTPLGLALRQEVAVLSLERRATVKSISLSTRTGVLHVAVEVKQPPNITQTIDLTFTADGKLRFVIDPGILGFRLDRTIQSPFRLDEVIRAWRS
jgi:hypothetical protein